MICTDLDRSDQGMKNLRYDIRGNGPKNNIYRKKDKRIKQEQETRDMRNAYVQLQAHVTQRQEKQTNK